MNFAVSSRVMRASASPRALLVLGAVVFSALVVACSDDDTSTPTTTPDASTPHDSGIDATKPTPDAQTPADAGADTGEPTPDAQTPTDAASDTSTTPDANGGDAAVGPAPVVLAIPTPGHARLFNVAYDATGNIYGVGVLGDAANATDLATFVVKVLPTGVVDTTFGTAGVAVKNVSVGAAGESVRGIAIQADGKIVVAGAAEHGLATESTRDVTLVRFTTTGAVDTTFGAAGVVRLPLTDGVSVQQWGLGQLSAANHSDLIVSGARKAAGDASTLNEFFVARLDATTGALVTTFGVAGVLGVPFSINISPRNLNILPDDSAIVSGYCASGGGQKPIVLKVTPAGVLDATFGTGGVFFPETSIPGFDATGSAEAYAAVPQGTKLVTTGYGKLVATDPALGFMSIRLNANGTVDQTYGTTGHVVVNANAQNAQSRQLLVLSDNRIVLVGGASPPKASADAGNLAQQAAVVILGENGALDPAYAAGPKLYDLGGPATGRAAHFFWGVAQSPDKKHIALAGIKGSITAVPDAGVAGGLDQAVLLVLPTGL